MKQDKTKQHLINPAPLTAALLGSMVLISCTGAPVKKDPVASEARPQTTTISTAFSDFERRSYADANAAYERATASDGQTKRLALLGQALIHLSTDPEWRNIEAAAQNLGAAEAVGGSADIETRMLMNAMSSLIGVESNIAELSVKANNSGSETARLKADLEAAAAERDALLEEQAALNEVIEKLKALTIGN